MTRLRITRNDTKRQIARITVVALVLTAGCSSPESQPNSPDAAPASDALGGGDGSSDGVNECLTNNGGCSASATCTDLPVGNLCACDASHAGDGYVCLPRLQVDHQFENQPPTYNEFYGRTVAVSGDGTRLAVGAPYHSTSTEAVVGAVYIYERTAQGWNLEATLAPTNPGTSSSAFSFGTVVALSSDGTTLAVGAPGEDSTGSTPTPPAQMVHTNDSGAVYMFRRSGSTWAPEAFIKAPLVPSGDNFGSELALSGDGATLAAARQDRNHTTAGAVDLFVRNASTWSFQATITAFNAGTNDGFGMGLALDAAGNTLAVGSPGEDTSGSGIDPSPDDVARESGAVYTYTRSSGVWSFQTFIKAPVVDTSSLNGAADLFGYSVSLDASGQRLAVGAPMEDSSGTMIDSVPNFGAVNSGAVFLYERVGTSWAFAHFIKAPNPTGTPDDFFGDAVAISADGKAIAVGAPQEDGIGYGVDSTIDPSSNITGAAYLYAEGQQSWFLRAYIKRGEPMVDASFRPGDKFGDSIALSADGSVVAVGATQQDHVEMTTAGTVLQSGAVYTYRP